MMEDYKTILSPVDGSEESELAFRKAVHVAQKNNAKLLIVHVIDTRAIQTPSGFEGNFTDEIVRQTKVMIDRYESLARERGVQDIETIIDYGSPKVMIAKEIAVEHKADLIMIGATGLNAVERLFIGSVSEYVIRHAPCDVTVVRTDLDNHLLHEKK
ncbi:universal stress protein [Jeotgalibaca porci]|uniref:Universal stress protein n=2 Tax=Jeotgalibaca porci TaxID=1868793 RepID=A0A6G7WFK5_9LACT|nr:universal stress protein [Jeotgalibaca porci]NLB98553.1 universal stress protein [Lactobacillales bacterium]QIK51026.1 universal stress protein [Jeotgalibaca porci]